MIADALRRAWPATPTTDGFVSAGLYRRLGDGGMGAD